jgi:hypothetical protein
MPATTADERSAAADDIEDAVRKSSHRRRECGPNESDFDR